MSDDPFQEQIEEVQKAKEDLQAQQEESQKLISEADRIRAEEEVLREKARIAGEKRRNVLQNWSGFGNQSEKKITDKRVTFQDMEPETHYVETHHEPSTRYKANLVKQKIEETRVKAINSLFEEGGLLQEKMNAGEDITWRSIKSEIENSLQQHFSYGINALIPIYTDELLKLKDKKEELNDNLNKLEENKQKTIADNRSHGMGMVDDVVSALLENINESIRQTKIKISRMVRKIRNAEYNINELIEQAGRQMELKKREKQYIQRQLQEYAIESDPSADPLAQAQWRNELAGRRRGLQEEEFNALFGNFYGERKSGGRKKKTRRKKKKNKRKTRRRKKRKKTRRRKKGGRRKTRRCVKL